MKSLIKLFRSTKKDSNSSKPSSAKEAKRRSSGHSGGAAVVEGNREDIDNNNINNKKDPEPNSVTSPTTANDDDGIASSSVTAAAAVAVPHQMTAGDVEDVVQFAKYFWELMNRHDTDAAKALCTVNCNVKFLNEDMEISMEDFLCEAANVFASFTDLRFDTGGYRPHEDEHSVLVPWFQAKGTHLGEPYGFGPFPPIAAQGIAICNDPEELIMKVIKAPPNHPSGCKFLLSFMSCRCLVKESERSGPPGFYRQIGGFPC